MKMINVTRRHPRRYFWRVLFKVVSTLREYTIIENALKTVEKRAINTLATSFFLPKFFPKLYRLVRRASRERGDAVGYFFLREVVPGRS
jgi:hypothetical protein